MRAMMSALLAGLFLVSPQKDGAAQQLSFGYIEFPPYYGTVEGKPQGTLIDLLGRITERTGIGFRPEAMPTRRLMESVVAGTVDSTILVGQPEPFNGTTLMSRHTTHNVTLIAISREDAGAISNPDGLKGHKVLGLAGYTYGGLIDFLKDPANNIRLSEARTVEQALALVSAGRAEYLLYYREPLDSAYNGNPGPWLRTQTLSRLPGHIFLSNKVTDARVIMERLEAALIALKTEQ